MFSDQDKITIIKNSDKDEINSIFLELGWYNYNSENLFEMIVKSGLATSNSDARKTIESWAFYINEQKITDIKYDFSNDFINWILLIRKWKKNFKLVIKK
jgi:tyrosyl-tRNA synthetase